MNEMFTQLPTVASAQMTDIVCAVQGYVSTSSPGLSVQETLQQVFNLFQSNVVLVNAGNPNGALAGLTNQLAWDSADMILWVCTTSGSSSTAVWTKCVYLTAGSGITISQASGTITVSANGEGITWNSTTGSTQAMVTNNGYQANYASSLATYTLPTTSSFGDLLYVLGGSSSGWTITQATGQKIIVGSASSTTGTGGSVSSTLASNSIQLICTVANTTWQTPVGPQGILTIV